MDKHEDNPGLFVTVAGVGDRGIFADQRATIRDLVGALGGDQSNVLVVQRTGQSLLPSAPVCFSDIRCGDVVKMETSVDVRTTEVTIGAVTLKALSGSRKGDEIALQTGENRIGRAADNDVLLTDSGVSRYHAVVTVDESMVTVADVGSTNGVLVGDDVIDGPTSLDAADRVLVGQTWFEVCYEKSAVGGSMVERGHRWDAAESAFCPVVVTPGSRPFKPYVGQRISFPVAPARGRLRRRAGSEGFEAAVSLFNRSVQASTAALVKEIDTEWSARLGEAPALSEIAEVVAHDQTRLWPRAANDPLIARIGLSSLPSRIDCVVPPDGDDDLRAQCEAVVAQHRNVEGVPVTVDFTSAHSVLVAGNEQRSRELAYALLGQLVTQHSPQRMRLWGLLSPDRVDEWEWMKWLPHCAGLADEGSFGQLTADPQQYDTVVKRLLATVNQGADPAFGTPDGAPSKSGTGSRFFPDARTADGIADATADLTTDEQAERVAAQNGSPATDAFASEGTNEILVIDGQAVVPNRIQSIIEAMATQTDVRVTVVVVGPCDPTHRVELPFGHKGAIIIADDEHASLETAGSESPDAVLGINCELVSLGETRSLARAMSCVAIADAASVVSSSAGSDQPVDVSDLDSLIRGADPAILVEQWADRENPGRLSARIGVNEHGPLKIDLRQLGPHALVSGDLGAFLPAWICSLAANYSPSDLNFYLIDSTGGSVFRNCQELPHTIGMLSDTSVLQIKPALATLSAEMDRREAVLSTLNGDTIEDLERQGRSSPFPYLVVAVDQVEQLGGSGSRSGAAVVSLDPTTELLTLSERGQQLGVHLLLGSSSNQRLSERIALRIHAGQAGASSSLTVGHAPPALFSATTASSRHEVVVKSFDIDNMTEISRVSLPAGDHNDLDRLTKLITNAHQFSGDPLPSSLS